MVLQTTDASVPSSGKNRSAGLVRACSLEDLRRDGIVTMGGSGHNVALFWHEGQAYAVDNRCPHMGFPLSKGFCKDGLLTCYWHYARFDLKSGGTFDPWADDVRGYPVSVRDGDVWVDLRHTRTSEEEQAHWTKRLREGLEQNIPLVQAKAILSLMEPPLPESAGTGQGTATHIVATAAAHGLRYGSRRNRGGWGDGLTILTAMAALQEDLAPEDRPLALYHGARRVGEDAAGQMVRFDLDPLPAHDAPPARLEQWFREFVEVRDAQAAERALRTAIAAGWTPEQLIDLLASAATDHYYRDFSHVMDTLAHAADLLDRIGWHRAAEVLPAMTAQWAAATREEENNSWRHPENLAGMVANRVGQLGTVLDVAAKPTATWDGHLVAALLGTDPERSLDAVMTAFRNGMALTDAAQALAYASAIRLARFPTSNEFGDWDTALHGFTYCASLAQVAKRAPSLELARAVLDGAMVVYQTRFLNVPAARLPGKPALEALPSAAETLLGHLSDACEQQGGVDKAGALTYRYLTLGYEPAPLIRTLGHAVLREDGSFHDYQMLEEGVRLAKDIVATDPTAPDRREASSQVLVAIARWQAAHAPTRRATTQTYDIALRLHRGEAVYEGSA
jgi:nitrite reductase/ring-hydroxylating ferredoxin subunit